MISILVLGLSAACTSGSSGSAPGVVGVQKGFGAPLEGGEASRDPAYRPRGLALRTFSANGLDYAPIDIESEELELVFDPSARRAFGNATVKFKTRAAGRPYLLLDASVISAKLDGENVATKSVNSPADEPVLSIDERLSNGEEKTLELRFEIPSARIGWADGEVGFLTDMSDIGVHFFERYGPANYEDDPFALTLRLKIESAITKPHSLFTNGQLTKLEDGEWRIEFPKHYTSSSFYVHLTNRALNVKSFEVKGLERSIPVTIYGADEAKVNEASARMPGLIAGIEADFGPYAHPGFIAYVTKSSGGMEYVGATITSVSALSHELFHSWFARGVMPAEGRSGWIDEGLASWRDRGFPRATSLLSRTPTSFDKPSVFDRNTTSRAYAEGRALMAEFDLKFAASGGLRPVLKRLFSRYRLALMTNQEFEAALEETTASDLSGYFARYVSGDDVSSPVEIENDPAHPTPLTEEEVRELR